jgi:hypothetical protein
MIHIGRSAFLDGPVTFFGLRSSCRDVFRAWRWQQDIQDASQDGVAFIELLPFRPHPDKGEERPIWLPEQDHSACPLCIELGKALGALGWVGASAGYSSRHRAWQPPVKWGPLARAISRGSAVLVYGPREDMAGIADAWARIEKQDIPKPRDALPEVLRLDPALTPRSGIAAPVNAIVEALSQLGKLHRWPFLYAVHHFLTLDSGDPKYEEGDLDFHVRLQSRQVLSVYQY